jgi:hypothetical protein
VTTGSALPLVTIRTDDDNHRGMAGMPDRIKRAAWDLDKATEELGEVIKETKTEESGWRERSGDVSLLREQVIDIREQLEILKMEVTRGSTATS